MKHTELPWETTEKPYIVYSTGEGEMFSNGDWSIYPPLGESGPVAIVASKEDAEYIVKACNMFPEVIEIIDETVNSLGNEIMLPYDIVARMEALLKKAKE